MDSQNSKESTVNIPSLETLGELLPLTHQVAGQTSKAKFYLKLRKMCNYI